MSHHDDEDDVESLFRLAGRRHRLADADLEPIRANARVAWQRHVRRTRWQRRAGVGGVALAAALALVVVYRQGGGWRQDVPPPAPLATLVLEVGKVEVTTHGGGRGVLSDGSTVATGADGRAALRLAAGPSVRLDVGTAVRFDDADRLLLERGAIYLDAEPGGAGSPVSVSTALGTIRHLGTQFEARLLDDAAGPVLQVRVREGRVRIERPGRSWELAAGRELTVDGRGGTREGSLPAHDPSWEWTQKTAPALDIDGATLAAFLAWVARETGLGWRYADPELANAAQGIVLHGSIEGLTPTEALSVVLPGCGLRYHRGAGELRLERDPGR